MTPRIKIATLDGCSKCENFKQKLEHNNLRYIEVSCTDDSNDSYCNQLEDLAKCDMYPMTIIDEQFVIALASDYEKLLTQTATTNVFYCDSIDNMIYITKNYLSL